MATAIKSSAGSFFLIPVGSSSIPSSSACSYFSSSVSSQRSRTRTFSSPTDLFQDSEGTREGIGRQPGGINLTSGSLLIRGKSRVYSSSSGRRGRFGAPCSFRNGSHHKVLIGSGLCTCKLTEDASQESGRSRIGSFHIDTRNGSVEAQEAPFLREGIWEPEFRIDGGGLLMYSMEQHHTRLVEGIRRVVSKDREWLEELLLGVREADAGDRRTTVLGEEWNRRILVAVPGFVGLNLSGPQSVLEALGVLAAIITVHEAGHFLAARLQNIHVTKFAIGFGPTLAKYQQKGVEYSLRAFPFGGFVAFPDDDPNSEFSPDDPNLLKNRPLLDRALVISAGVIANIIFAYTVLFVQTLGVGLLEREVFPGVMVPEVISKSAAAKAGMQVGDVVLAVDGYELSAQDSAVFELVDTIKRSPGRPITLSVQRGQDVVGVKVIPDENRDGSGRIGVQLSPNARPHRVKADNLLDAAVKSGREFGMLFGTVLDGLKQILFNFEKTVDSVSGPVAIVAVGAEVARSDISGLYQFAAIVNINLAIVNLLPLPALDGGYLAFVLLEALRGGKKLPDGVEQGIMSSGVLLLLALGIVLMVRDTLNLGFVQQML
ncbi:unnamed protein product [Calypogeia fissa]